MLKFKQIKSGIMNRQNKKGRGVQAKQNDGGCHSPLMFKTVSYHQGQSRSPFGNKYEGTGEKYQFQTNRKEQNAPFYGNFQSDTKENSAKNIYIQPMSFSTLNQQISFNPQTKRKMTLPQPMTNLYTENSNQSNNTPTKNNLSFASLVQSKKSNQNSGYKGLGTERKNERESSISKLKDKLFGLKKVISNKEQPYSCVTPTKKKNSCQTNREPSQSPFTPTPAPFVDQIVKMSIDQPSPLDQLDMSPCLP